MKDTMIATLCSAAFLSLMSIALAAPMSQVTSLPNFGTVDPGLYRGAAPTQAGLAKLKGLGVQVVVDLRISPRQVKAERMQVKQLGMRFVNLPMGSDPPTAKEKAEFLSLAAQAKEHPVYVHCQYGADRTGVMVGLYRRVQDHWDYPRAYAEMRHYGFKPYYTQLAAVVKNAAPR